MGWASEEGAATAQVQDGSPELAEAVTRQRMAFRDVQEGWWEAREQ